MKTRPISLTVALAMAGGVAQVAGAAPATDLVCTGCVQANDLATNAVTAAKLVANSVTGAKISDGSVAAADLAAGSVDASKIKDGSVALGDLATDSVDTSKIKDGSVALGDLAADSVDTGKIKNGSVGLADLAPNSVDGSKIVNGSIAQADLNAALLARLTKMEADIAALKGGPYSNATFKGTYRCMSFSGEVGGNAVYGQTYASVFFHSLVNQLTADGIGSLTYSQTELGAGRRWWVGYNATDKANYLATKAETGAPDTYGDTLGYSVAADGKLTFSPTASEDGVIDEGWIARNGDTVILRWVNNWVEGNRSGITSDLSVCVRTAR